MNIKYIKLINFGPFSDEVIQFKEDGIYSFVAKNGSGKTFLTTDALTYSLYGCSRIKGAGDEVIKTGTNKMLVEVGFELNDNKYVVRRLREIGKGTKLQLFQIVDKVAKNLSGNVIKETQDKINNILRMDYDTFINSICFTQGGSDSFSKLTPKEAKEQIMKILCLTIYDRCSNLVKSKIIDDTGSLRLELDMIKEEIKSFSDIKNNDTKLVDIKVEINEVTKSYKNKIPAYEKLKTDIENKEKDIDTKIKKNIVIIGRLTERLEKLTNTKDKCPTCLTEITNNKLKEIMDKTNKEISFYKEGIRNLKNNLEKLDNKKLKKLGKEIDDLKLKEDYLNKNYIGLESEIKANADRTKRLKNLQTKVKKIKEDISKKEKLNNKYHKLLKTFGKEGIPSYIIENTVPEIEEITNKIMSKLSDNIYVEFITQRELKSKKIADTLLIMINNRPYYTYSGGEKMLIDFAIRVALSVVLSRRNGAKIETLILDEIFGSLDYDNKNKMIEAINIVRRIFGFKKIFLISHCEDVQDTFENQIKIVKDSSGSKIE